MEWNRKRISLKNTRAIIDAIINGEINEVATIKIPFLNLTVPIFLTDIGEGILDPRDSYADVNEWEKRARDLASRRETNVCDKPRNITNILLCKIGCATILHNFKKALKFFLFNFPAVS